MVQNYVGSGFGLFFVGHIRIWLKSTQIHNPGSNEEFLVRQIKTYKPIAGPVGTVNTPGCQYSDSTP